MRLADSRDRLVLTLSRSPGKPNQHVTLSAALSHGEGSSDQQRWGGDGAHSTGQRRRWPSREERCLRHYHQLSLKRTGQIEAMLSRHSEETLQHRLKVDAVPSPKSSPKLKWTEVKLYRLLDAEHSLQSIPEGLQKKKLHVSKFVWLHPFFLV